MKNQNVYIKLCGKTIISVYDSKEKAFNSLPQQDEFTEVTQSINTNDGGETIIPTEECFYLGVPICVHVKAHRVDVLSFSVYVQEETTIYEIEEFKVK